jgi:DnaJ-class molecular chaperone
MTDPYRVLGVREDATQDEIATAYHRLVRRYHPDTTASASESDRFREVVAAYAALRDREPAERLRPAPRAAEPAIRVGPVRYHGPPHRP